MIVFVYGSLRKGFGNHELLSNSDFLGRTKVKDMDMYNLGAFPMCFEGDGIITVEAYDVSESTLKTLDRLEGIPTFYDRKWVTATNRQEGWIYVGVSKGYMYNKVVTGDWKDATTKTHTHQF